VYPKYTAFKVHVLKIYFPRTGFEFASKIRMVETADSIEKPVMHACGHDVHITTLLAAAETLFNARAEWSGTLLCLFQPAEEKGTGAMDMVKDDVYKKIGHIPDVELGAHVSPHPAGFVGIRPGPITSNCNGFKVTVYGCGGHASMPDTTVDPVVLASHIVVRLQTIVSREVSPADMVVLTIGSIESGEAENIISDQAILRVNIRSYKKDVRDRVLASVKRIVDAECVASGTPKPALIESTCDLPLTPNDPEHTTQLSASFKDACGQLFNNNVDMIPGSEDFSVLATEIGRPCCFWLYGNIAPYLNIVFDQH
jgi:amidohydrolase